MGLARQGTRARTSRRQRQHSARRHRLALQGLQRLLVERRQDAAGALPVPAYQRTGVASRAARSLAAPGLAASSIRPCRRGGDRSCWRPRSFASRPASGPRWSQLEHVPAGSRALDEALFEAFRSSRADPEHGDATAQHRRTPEESLTLTGASRTSCRRLCKGDSGARQRRTGSTADHSRFAGDPGRTRWHPLSARSIRR